MGLYMTLRVHSPASPLGCQPEIAQFAESLKLTDPDPVPEAVPDAVPDLSPRRRRLNFRAWHRGTKETDLMVGAFVARHIAAFSEAELDELEQILELPDVDLADWLMQRRPIPAEVASPLLARMLVECNESGAGLPPHLR